MVLLETSALSLSVSAPCLGGWWEEKSWRGYIISVLSDTQSTIPGPLSAAKNCQGKWHWTNSVIYGFVEDF